mgnify:CR=1 FL=1|tara:strand:+ start:1674 stop:2057 length:384 start_codon:yes stop_codon:yes gene_type:complete
MNKEVYTKVFLRELGKTTNDSSITEYLPIWWKNTRQKEEGGLRLTEAGFDMLDEIDISIYEIPFPPDMTLTTQVIIFLDKFIDCPYYLTKNSIYVTKEKKAVELTLFSGDMRKYGIAKALNRAKDLE